MFLCFCVGKIAPESALSRSSKVREADEAWCDSGVKKRCSLCLGKDDATVLENSRSWEMTGGV